MQRLSVLLVLCFFLSGGLLFSRDDQEYIPVDSLDYQLLDAVLLDAGMVGTSAVKPLTRLQIRNMLNLAGDRTAPELLELVSTIGRSERDAVVNAVPRFGLELKARTAPGIAPVHDGNDQIPVFSLETTLSWEDSLFILAEYEAREDPLVDLYDPAPWSFVNLPGAFEYFDIHTPRRAWASIGGDFWNIGLGRDRLAIGTGNQNKMILGTEPPFYEFAQARVFGDTFSYALHYLSMDTRTKPGEIPIDQTAEYPAKFYVNHRLDLALLDHSLRLGLNEGLMVGGQAFDIKYLNPFMILHSFANWLPFSNPWAGTASSFFAFDADWAFLPGWSAYGTWGFNQFTLPNEAAAGDSGMPGAAMWLLGLQSSGILEGGLVDYGLEVALADPWMYLRENPWNSFVWRYYRISMANAAKTGSSWYVQQAPMGFSWGPDSASIALWYTWISLDQSLSLSFNGETAWQGENGFDSAWKVGSPVQTGPVAVAMRTPTGVPEIHTVLSLAAGIRPWKFLETRMGYDFHLINQKDHVAGNSLLSHEFWASVEFAPAGL